MGGALFNQGGTVTLSGVTITASAAIGGSGYGGDFPAPGYLGGASGSFYGGFGAGGGTASSNAGFGGGQSSLYQGPDDGGDGMGGAIFNCNGTVNLTNCTLAANSAVGGNGGSGYGGAIFSLNGSVTLTNDTISGNTAAQGGAGIFAYSGTASGAGSVPVGSTGIFNMTNTIVGPIDDLAVSGSPSFSGSNNIVCNNAAGFPSAGISSTSNPLIGALASNGGPTQTMLPGSGSPAISAGTTLGAPSTDQRGTPRNGVVNIGAVQITKFLLSTSLDQPRIMIGQMATLNSSITNVQGAGEDSLNYTLAASIVSGSGSLGALSNSGGTGLAPGLTSSPASTAIFTAGTATGPVTLSLSATATNTTLGGSASGTTPISVSLDVLAQRIVTASAIDLGVQHLGPISAPVARRRLLPPVPITSSPALRLAEPPLTGRPPAARRRFPARSTPWPPPAR